MVIIPVREKYTRINYNLFRSYDFFYSFKFKIEFNSTLCMQARYLCSRDALGLKAEQLAGQARRATIGYLVYNSILSGTLEND